MAVAIYMKVDGLTGESAVKQGYVDVTGLSWGANQPIKLSGGGLGAGKVTYCDLSVTAKMDTATPGLLKFCSTGKHIEQVVISFCKAGGSQIEYSTILLKEVFVKGARFIASGGATEVGMNYTFAAAKVEHHYWKQSKDGTKGAEFQMGWDLKKNIATA